MLGKTSFRQTCGWTSRYVANKSQKTGKKNSFLPSVISLLMAVSIFQLFSPVIYLESSHLLYEDCDSRTSPVPESLRTSALRDAIYKLTLRDERCCASAKMSASVTRGEPRAGWGSAHQQHRQLMLGMAHLISRFATS